jgi:hypothetical protein
MNDFLEDFDSFEFAMASVLGIGILACVALLGIEIFKVATFGECKAYIREASYGQTITSLNTKIDLASEMCRKNNHSYLAKTLDQIKKGNDLVAKKSDLAKLSK